ncbi:MAG: hypothetical protein J5830_04110 [Clostridia bacterium]|nr:hypothetical protein [Clostridia bacterium]
MKVSEKNRKIWFAALMAAAGVNVVLWSLTWRLDYDVSPGVFGRGILSGFAVASCIVCVIISLLPAFFSGRGNAEAGDFLTDTSRRGSEAAALTSCFIIAASVLTVLKSSDGGNTVVALLALVLSVPAAVYFASVCILKNQDAAIIRVCAPFPPLWGIFVTLYHYLSTARAINDPIKVVCQFIPIGIMLYITAEMKMRLSECTKSYFFTTRAVLVTIGSVSLSLVIDATVTAVSNLISQLGADVAPGMLVFAVRPHELTLAIAGVGAALYALGRRRGTTDETPAEPEEPLPEETVSEGENDVTEITDEIDNNNEINEKDNGETT